MHRRSIACLFLLASWFSLGAAPAGDSPPENLATAEDFLERYSATFRFRLGRPTAIEITPDGRAVLFVRSGPRSFVGDLYELDLASGRERLLLEAESLLGGESERLTAEEKARRERMRMTGRGIATYEISSDGKLLLAPLSGRLFLVNRSTGKSRQLRSEAGFAIDPRFSPDGSKVACVRDNELYVTDVASGEEKRLTSGAGGTVTHGLAEFVAQEEMHRYHGYWWSPDSRSIVYQRTDTAGVEVMHIMDAMRPEQAPASWPYPRPGKPNADVRLGIISAGGGPTTWIEWNREKYEYVADVRWMPRAPLTVLVQNRRQTEERLLGVNVRDGSTTTLLVERDAAWINLDSHMPYWLPDGSAFLWTTERNGAMQLELRDRTGELVGPLNEISFGLQEFGHFFPGSNEVIVEASRDPTQSQLYRLSLDPDRPRATRMTDEPGVHSVVSKRAGDVFVYSISTDKGDNRYEVANRDNKLDLALRSVAEEPGFVPNLEFTKVGSDPDYHAVLIRPGSFDPEQRYPVIVHVYGGPGGQMVRRTAGRYLIDQWMADRGYIVVAIDGRGTPGRGRDWERSIKGDLIALPLEDQASALIALGKRYPELDLSRVGIHGWSFGGYFTAMALTRRPDLFRIGIVGAPVVAWEDYDTHYTERYMDLPQDNPEGYAAASVLTYADRLERPLLLVHGTADDNVYFLHSLKLVDALLRSGREFDFLPLPGITHMVPEPLVNRRLHDRVMALFDSQLKNE